MSPRKDKKTDKKLAKKAAGPGTLSDNELTEAEINDLQENIQVSDWGEGAPPRKAKAFWPSTIRLLRTFHLNAGR